LNSSNRLWQALLPVQTPVGVAFQAIAPLDFDIISSFGQEEAKPPPAWEGILEGLDVLQLFEGDFGGRQRAFAAVHSREDGSIQVWEFTDFLKTDNGDNRVTWYFETPAYTWNKDFALKQLDGGEVWIDKVSRDHRNDVRVSRGCGPLLATVVSDAVLRGPLDVRGREQPGVLPGGAVLRGVSLSHHLAEPATRNLRHFKQAADEPGVSISDAGDGERLVPGARVYFVCAARRAATVSGFERISVCQSFPAR
jgi:hypothetical protein